MKMLSLVSLLVLTTAACSLTAHADEPDPAQIAKLTPQMQAMLKELLKAAEVDPADPAPAPTPAAPTPAAPAQSPTAPVPPTTSLTPATGGLRAPKTAAVSTALQTGSLRTGHLGTSGSLSGAPRLNDDEWRQLFPVRK